MPSNAYPRDLRGYGRDIPHARWPGDARIAVQFVVNYEEGGENCILHGDAASEAFLSEIVGAQPWPGQRHMNMESIYEYGSRSGYWRLYRLFTSRQVPVTVFAVASALARYPDIVPSMKEAGWEIATHGLKWIDYANVPESDEAAHIQEAIRLHDAMTGSAPVGFYAGRCSVNTVRIAMESQQFVYCADSYSDELPYWIEGQQGFQLIVPYTLDANDMRFATPQGFNSGDQFYSYLKDSFDVLYAEGRQRPRMMSIGLHCRLVGRPGRAAALARFVDYARSHSHVWFATRLDIARHWIATHPPVGGLPPSRMPRALFLDRFGDVLEHSPPIARNVYQSGLCHEQDSIDGLHVAFMGAVQALDRSAQLALIMAHPELAGREAVEGTLTRESSGEQGRLGFTQLTRDEFVRIGDINHRYRTKFGFPAIVALARHARRETVLAEMERRLANDLETEVNNALEQIGHIIRSRLERRL